jgi:site-specific DNA recombinase
MATERAFPHLILDEALGSHPPVRRRAVIYARRSYDPHLKARATRDQITDGRRACERNDWDVAGVFEDPDNSASRHSSKARPDYQALVALVEAGGCDVIVAWESNRLSRDITVFTRLADLCERHGVWLCLNGTVYDMSNSQQRFFAQLTVLQGGYEADTIRDRNLRTMSELAREGRPTGIVPYGFAREYDPASGALLRQVPDAPQAEVVRELTREVAAGVSLKSLARRMAQRGVPAPGAGAAWSSMTVRALVLRATNIGMRVHNGKVVGPAAWPGIVDEHEYYAALRILKDPARVTRRDTTVKYLLSGLALCWRGHRLRPHAVSGRMAYVCMEKGCASMRVETLDAVVQSAVLAHVELPAFAASLAPSGGGDRVRAALERAAHLEAELARARVLAGTVTAQGRLALSPEGLAAVEAQVLPLVAAARREARDASVPPVLRLLAGQDARQVWEGLGLEQRRAALRDLVVVTVNAARPGARTITPERITWDWLR